MRKKQNKKSIYLIFGGIVIGFLFTVFYSLARHPQTEVLQPQIEARHLRVDGDPGSQESQKNTSIQNNEEKSLDSRLRGNDDIGSISESQKSASKARISIAGKDLEVVITNNMSVYDAMNVLKEEEKITFEGKNYPGLGFFVTKVNSLESGNGKNLFYYINDEEASLGISSYILKEGDIIEWKLK